MDFDDKVKALASKYSFGKITRPIKWIPKEKAEDDIFEIGNVMYVLGEGEYIPIVFMGAFKIRNWIICLESNTKINSVMIGGFYKDQEHYNFGPVQGYKEFFDFFNKKILTLYSFFKSFNLFIGHKLWMIFYHLYTLLSIILQCQMKSFVMTC